MKRLATLAIALFSLPLSAQSIAFISDLNGRYGSVSYDARVIAAVNTIIELRPDAVISTGDMVAGQKTRLDSTRLNQMWHAFNFAVADPLARAGIPFAVAVGNHDGSAYPEYALDRAHFEAQWLTRSPPLDMLPGSEWPWRYVARLGPLLLVAFDSTQPGELPDRERQFLEQALQRYGSGATATIVYSHLPMWPVTRGREHEIIDDHGLLELLHRSGVDVYASGHHHAYYAGVDESGMVHLSVGALGGNARAFSGRLKAQPHSFALLTFEHGAVKIASRAAPAFEDPVPLSQLPPTLSGPLGVLRRVEQPVRLRP